MWNNSLKLGISIMLYKVFIGMLENCFISDILKLHKWTSFLRLFHYKYCTKFTANTLSTQIFLNPMEPLLNNATYFLRTSF